MNNASYTVEHCRSLPKFDHGVSMVSYGYNEEELIEDFLRHAHKLMSETVEDYEIVFVNDGSTDHTGVIAHKVAQELPNIFVYDNEKNIDMNAIYAGRRAISLARKEFTFWQTVDWSYDIARLRGFLELLRDADVLVGVRRKPVEAVNRAHKILAGLARLLNIRHLTRRSDTIGKAIISVSNYMLVRLLFGVPLSDYQNVCIYRTKFLLENPIEALSSFGNPELQFKAYWAGLRIAEVPINFIPRSKGEAKGTRFKSVCASIKDVFRFWWRWRVLGLGPDRSHPGSIRRLRADEWDNLV
ncbi:MAG: hypothetical protein A2283_01810 [Lentisphaerae bacterium RIFOXYA12_FULL_48_11]|nr:MAG: hypothetical protein A2283_01810 [Lentisphaerae bacterium RIFOXYA12_FULL_48_11]